MYCRICDIDSNMNLPYYYEFSLIKMPSLVRTYFITLHMNIKSLQIRIYIGRCVQPYIQLPDHTWSEVTCEEGTVEGSKERHFLSYLLVSIEDVLRVL